MLAVSHKDVQRSIQRFLACALMLTGLAFAAPAAHAAEIIPSLGMTRSPENGDKTNISYGLAVRAPIVPMVSAELGLGYRKEELFDGNVESTQWPVTGSLWVKALPSTFVIDRAGYLRHRHTGAGGKATDRLGAWIRALPRPATTSTP